MSFIILGLSLASPCMNVCVEKIDLYAKLRLSANTRGEIRDRMKRRRGCIADFFGEDTARNTGKDDTKNRLDRGM